MIDYLDGLLGQLFSTRIPGLPLAQISFNAPDQTWRTFVSGAPGIALNVYLVELYENVELRSEERVMQTNAGVVEETRSPARLDCRYLISAWSPATANPLVDPAVDEGVLLYQVTQVLYESVPLDANAIYAPNPLPAGFPDAMVAPELPAVIAPEEPFEKLADFWMRMDTIWKPVVDLVVTLPVVYEPREAGAAVTTLFGEFGTRDGGGFEEVVTIGGIVRYNNQPVPGAWVRLVELDRTVAANAAGQFVFSGIRRGNYTLESGATGHATRTRPVAVPSLSGEYDLDLP